MAEYNLPYTGDQTSEYLAKARDFSGEPLDDGLYAGSKTYTAYDQYLNDNGALFKLNPSVALGYTIDIATYPLAKDDPNLIPYSNFESASTEAIDDFNNITVPAALDEFTVQGNAAIQGLGWDNKGEFSTLPTMTDVNDVAVFEGNFWLPTEPLPYTATGLSPLLPPEQGKWVVAVTAELLGIARSLNKNNNKVQYTTYTGALDDVENLYDAGAQIIWGVPALNGTGETIVSVTGSTLETTGGTYELATQEKSDLKMTLAEAIASPAIALGDSIRITDRADGVFDVVTGATANTFDIIDATASGYQLQLRVNSYAFPSQFGAIGDGSNSDGAFARARTYGKPIIFHGEHELINFDLVDVDLRGIGVGTSAPKLLQRVNAPVNEYVLQANNQTGGTPSPTTNSKGIRIAGFEVVGRVATEGFLEQCHLVAVSAVSDFKATDVKFTGFKGDGLYIGSGLGIGGIERHNEDVTIDNCEFDGVNNDNRNGISIIDCRNFYLKYSKFKNCTRPNMPGAVDFEPNSNAYHILKNMNVFMCEFDNIGGGTGVIGFNIPAAVPSSNFGDFNIYLNTITNSKDFAADLYYNAFRDVPVGGTQVTLNYTGNTGENGVLPFYLRSLQKANLSGNSWVNYTGAAILGSTTVGEHNRDIQIVDNSLTRVTDANGVVIYSNYGLDINTNKFEDCGNGLTNAAALYFTTGSSDNVTISANEVTTTLGNTLIAIRDSGTHTFNALTNVSEGNTFSGLPSQFKAAKNDDEQGFNLAYDSLTLPDDIPFGNTFAVVNGDTGLPDALLQGTLNTVRYNETSGWTTQFFYPRYQGAAETISNVYMRRSNGAAWLGWLTIVYV